MTATDRVVTSPVVEPAALVNDADPIAPPSRRGIRAFLDSSLSLRLGLGLLGAYALVAIVSLVWTPHDPEAPAVGLPYSAPSSEHWFGTDRLGSDVFSKTMAAARLDLGITIAAVTVALVFGAALGTIAGYYRGVADGVIMRFLEVFQAFPSLLFAMLIVQAFARLAWPMLS